MKWTKEHPPDLLRRNPGRFRERSVLNADGESYRHNNYNNTTDSNTTTNNNKKKKNAQHAQPET